jgi:hypothetical protein
MPSSRIAERSAPDRRHRLEKNLTKLRHGNGTLKSISSATPRECPTNKSPGKSSPSSWRFGRLRRLVRPGRHSPPPKSCWHSTRRNEASATSIDGSWPAVNLTKMAQAEPAQDSKRPHFAKLLESRPCGAPPPPESQCRGNSAITREASRLASCSPPLASSNILFATNVLG